MGQTFPTGDTPRPRWAPLGPNANVTRASAASTGQPANSVCYSPAVSSDGHRVAFESHASNLVQNDGNGHSDVFVKDTHTDEVTMASVATDGTQGNGMSQAPVLSGDGSKVAFESWASNLATWQECPRPSKDGNVNLADGARPKTKNIYVRDLEKNATTCVTANANKPSCDPALSSDGNIVVFASYADNLTPDDTNGQPDIFVRDLTTGAISNITQDSTTPSEKPDVSADGKKIVFTQNNAVLLHDRDANDTKLLAQNANSAAISADGSTVAFIDTETHDVKLHDLKTGQTTRVPWTESEHECHLPTLSADGRYIAFLGEIHATDDAPGQARTVLVHDRVLGFTANVSVHNDGRTTNADCAGAALSQDGAHVVFTSYADNLTSDPPSEEMQVYLARNTSLEPLRQEVLDKLQAPPPSTTRDDDHVTVGGVKVPVKK